MVMGMIDHTINAKWLGSTYGAISCYYDLIVKEHVSPSHSGRGHRIFVITPFKTNK